MNKVEKRKLDEQWRYIQQEEAKKEQLEKLKKIKANIDDQFSKMDAEDREFLESLNNKKPTDEEKNRLQIIHSKYFFNDDERLAFRKSAIRMTLLPVYADCMKTDISRIKRNFKVAFGGKQTGTMKQAVKERIGKGDCIRQDVLQLVELIEREAQNMNRHIDKLNSIILSDTDNELKTLVYNQADYMQDLFEAVYVRTVGNSEQRIKMMIEKIKKYKVQKGLEGIFG